MKMWQPSFCFRNYQIEAAKFFVTTTKFDSAQPFSDVEQPSSVVEPQLHEDFPSSYRLQSPMVDKLKHGQIVWLDFELCKTAFAGTC